MNRRVRVEVAGPDDELAIRRLLDAAVLEYEALHERLAAGDVLAARDDGRVVGALVLDRSGPDGRGFEQTDGDPGDHGGRPARIDAIAVRRSRRDSGIGTALVEAALAREGALTAAFDPDVRPFYEALGFEIRECGVGRLRGRIEKGK